MWFYLYFNNRLWLFRLGYFADFFVLNECSKLDTLKKATDNVYQ